MASQIPILVCGFPMRRICPSAARTSESIPTQYVRQILTAWNQLVKTRRERNLKAALILRRHFDEKNAATLLFGGGSMCESEQIPAIPALFLVNRCWHLDCCLTLQGGRGKRTGRQPTFLRKSRGANRVNSNYVFLCGVMWCKFGQQEAGKELLRAANSSDPDMSALALAMLARGARRLRDLERQARTSSRPILEARLSA